MGTKENEMDADLEVVRGKGINHLLEKLDEFTYMGQLIGKNEHEGKKRSCQESLNGFNNLAV